MTMVVAIVVLAAGVVVGVVSALFGVGGGVLMVPFLVLIVGLGQHAAEGTSLLVIVPTAIVGTIAHVRRGYVEVPTAARLAVGGVVGAVAGALLGLELSAGTLRSLFALLVALVGIRMIYDGIRLRATEPRG